MFLDLFRGLHSELMQFFGPAPLFNLVEAGTICPDECFHKSNMAVDARTFLKMTLMTLIFLLAFDDARVNRQCET